MKLKRIILIFIGLMSFQALSLEGVCSDDNDRFFCCLKDGEELEVIYPDMIAGEYNQENVTQYCVKRYGLPIKVSPKRNTLEQEEMPNY